MGLDNGIFLRKNDFEIEREDLQCYWRKWYTLRTDLFKILKLDNKCAGQENEITFEDLKKIKQYLKKKNVKNETYWYYEKNAYKELKRYNREQIKNLNKIIRLCKKDPLIQIIFYDSF
jgi:hypothetical protein